MTMNFEMCIFFNIYVQTVILHSGSPEKKKNVKTQYKMHPLKKFPLKYAVILTTIMIIINSSSCSLHHLSLFDTLTSLLDS